jgi:hypothetical protein
MGSLGTTRHRQVISILFFFLCSLLMAPAAHAASATSPFDALTTDRQEQLYYHDENLPDAVKKLIGTPVVVADAIAYFRRSKDDLVKFNIMIILEQQIHNLTLPGPDCDTANAFFATCLTNGNPWIETEAVFALGNAGSPKYLPQITRCLDSPYPTVVYHAIGAIHAITGNLPPLTRDQVAKFREVPPFPLGDFRAINAFSDTELKTYQASLSD